MKWTDGPVTAANVRPNTDVRRLVETLAEQPGRWAEVGRYPLTRKRSAYSRGSQTVRRYPVLQYAVQTDGDDVVLLFRVPTGEEVAP